MKKIKATALITSALVLGTALASVSASAATLSDSKNGASYFTSAWALEKQVPGTTPGKMYYGFNKFAIDEDFTHTIHDANGHTAIVTRGASNSSSAAGNAGKWAKIEVTHNNVSVQYSMIY
ncbi:hypothetical protein LOZ80_30860 [Paenibacillus sp. HWE-109]|uniref:mediterrocin family bacteriocin n=1 Tax=Paenibacillus sp. HWE-109 TaxID=1306526 RepID=UPI001EDD763D|nr:hypothetical protein [Paenibacillus sp. HWE-109]UKS25912.1 hypothetical protein LOZ80_30860 [Paenibacillus sp. HWE-109]